MPVELLEYYNKESVKREIYDFCKDRWVALHCEGKDKDGRPLLIRYVKDKPLVLKDKDSVVLTIRRFLGLRPRTFYATVNLYRKLRTKEDALNYYENVYARTPSWDIDSKPEWWRHTLEVARLVVDFLEKHGVVSSVYLKWSGRGLHVHLHEKAISEDVYAKVPALDLSYAIVEYSLRKIREKVKELNTRHGVEIKVENLMDPQRVFTAPLSLHKHLDVACVAFRPDALDSFDPSWLDPNNFKHDPSWRKHVEGEADELALKAYGEVGPYAYAREEAAPRGVDQQLIEKAVKRIAKEEKPTVRPKRYAISMLRLNLRPEPLEVGARRYSKGPEQVVLRLEDILSHYALGKIDLNKAYKAVIRLKYGVVPFQGYSPEEVEGLKVLCDAVLAKLLELRSPKRVREWLLGHGPPKGAVSLDKFFSSKSREK